MRVACTRTVRRQFSGRYGTEIPTETDNHQWKKSTVGLDELDGFRRNRHNVRNSHFGPALNGRKNPDSFCTGDEIRPAQVAFELSYVFRPDFRLLAVVIQLKSYGTNLVHAEQVQLSLFLHCKLGCDMRSNDGVSIIKDR